MNYDRVRTRDGGMLVKFLFGHSSEKECYPCSEQKIAVTVNEITGL